MDRFLVISEHTAEDCIMAVRELVHYNAGFLTHFEWGCKDDDHHAYAFVEAENKDQAKLSVPPLFRPKTKVIKLTHFKPRESKDNLHQKPQ